MGKSLFPLAMFRANRGRINKPKPPGDRDLGRLVVREWVTEGKR